MAAIGTLYSFTSGTIIRSSYVNQNFTDVKSAYNTHDTATTGIHGSGTGYILVTPSPAPTVQSVIAVNATGSVVDQNFYISPVYDLTVTADNGYTSVFAKGYFKRIGTDWLLNFKMFLSTGGNTGGSSISITNVVIKTGSYVFQPLESFSGTVSIKTTSYADPSSGKILVSSGAVENLVSVGIGGEILLESKPTGYLPAGV